MLAGLVCRLAGLTGPMNSGSVTASLVEFQGALKGFFILKITHFWHGGHLLGVIEKTPVIEG